MAYLRLLYPIGIELALPSYPEVAIALVLLLTIIISL